jgi:signal transduction histidine kinase
LQQVQDDWQNRCRDSGKVLVLEDQAGDAVVDTDVRLVQQILANLIDNACKYSRGSEDPRILVRVGKDRRCLFLAVQDHGPGVSTAERRAIFRPFRRGRGADMTAGGVGLGLALAHRWARLLGGTLVLQGSGEATGACFRLELPFETPA